MRVILPTSGVPIKNWASSLEPQALDQAVNLANLPFTFKHVALMPDSHSGYGMPIGGVLATKGVIIPNAVGVDIGCGMSAVRLDIKATDLTPDILKKIIGEARQQIPVGFNKHKDNQEWTGFDDAPDLPIIHGQLANARKSLGTLGGGNHFIEIQADEDDYVWVMLHSGSRNLGKQVCDFYHKQAVALCEQWHVTLPTSELSFLPMRTTEGQDYYRAMQFCLRFAEQNRFEMMLKMTGIIGDLLGSMVIGHINIHHNYAALENHFGENVLVHRKGATSARQGQLGIIPGSMGTASYIVEGRGNPLSFMSCSHGAGRRMGRKEACRSLDLAAEKAKMEGIVHGIRNVADLEEAPGAYKDIDQVMEDQQDLVEIRYKLRPLASMKG